MEQQRQMVFLKNAGAELTKRIGPNDVHEYAIRQWVLSGKVKSVRAGRRILVSMNSLINFLESGESDQLSETAGIRPVNEKLRA